MVTDRRAEPVPLEGHFAGAAHARFVGVARGLGNEGADPTVLVERDRSVTGTSRARGDHGGVVRQRAGQLHGRDRPGLRSRADLRRGERASGGRAGAGRPADGYPLAGGGRRDRPRRILAPG